MTGYVASMPASPVGTCDCCDHKLRDRDGFSSKQNIVVGLDGLVGSQPRRVNGRAGAGGAAR